MRKEAYEKYGVNNNYIEMEWIATEGTDDHSSTPIVGIEGSVNQAK